MALKKGERGWEHEVAGCVWDKEKGGLNGVARSFCCGERLATGLFA